MTEPQFTDKDRMLITKEGYGKKFGTWALGHTRIVSLSKVHMEKTTLAQ